MKFLDEKIENVMNVFAARVEAITERAVCEVAESIRAVSLLTEGQRVAIDKLIIQLQSNEPTSTSANLDMKQTLETLKVKNTEVAATVFPCVFALQFQDKVKRELSELSDCVKSILKDVRSDDMRGQPFDPSPGFWRKQSLNFSSSESRAVFLQTVLGDDFRFEDVPESATADEIILF